MTRLHELDTLVPTMLADNVTPGAAVIVVNREGEVYCRGFGSRDIGGERPVGADTRFAYASISKGMTAVLCGMLVADGVLRWDMRVRELLPGFQLADPVASDRCTLRDLFLHRSGLPAGDLIWWQRDLDEEHALALLPDIAPGQEFRTAFQYQNLHFAVVGAMLRAATSKDWHTLMRTRLLGPLGMDRAVTTVDGLTEDDDYARPTGPNGFAPPREWPFLHMGGLAPAGQVGGCIRDIGAYLRAMLTGDGIPAAVVKDVTTPQWPLGGQAWPELLLNTAGLGWMVQAYRGETCWSGAGGMNGYTSHCYALPDRGLAVAALGNRTSGAVPQALALEALDRAADLPSIDWAGRFLDQKRAFANARAERQAKRRAQLAPAPTHPLVAYAGVYTHPAYGLFEVDAGDDGLHARYYSIEARALPMGSDRFALFDTDDQIELNISFTGHGTITGLTAPLASGTPAVGFVKR